MKDTKLKYLAATLLVLLVFGLSNCIQGDRKRSDYVDVEHNVLSDFEIEEGWRLLFDGETTEGWRGYNMSSFPDGWEIEEGVLHLGSSAGDIIYDRKFRDFHLSVDWMISEGGNSGIFYLAQEIEDQPIWHSAPELQLLDNESHMDLDPTQWAPALYDLIPAYPQNTNPPGEWNTVEVVLRDSILKHFQNGEEVVSVQIGTPEWNEMVEESKFPSETFGKYIPGYIGLQDHGDEVWFRNIKVREF
jgi:hypothetical protein